MGKSDSSNSFCYEKQVDGKAEVTKLLLLLRALIVKKDMLLKLLPQNATMDDLQTLSNTYMQSNTKTNVSRTGLGGHANKKVVE